MTTPLQDGLDTRGRPVHIDGVFDVHRVENEARFSFRADPSVVTALSIAIKIEIPSRIWGVGTDERRTAMCLGPDEWLLSVPYQERNTIRGLVAESTKTVAYSLVEISDREHCLVLQGPKAVYALKAVCPLDIGGMTVGTAVRTLFDEADILILRKAGETFQLYVARSWTEHTLSLLGVIGREIAAGL